MSPQTAAEHAEFAEYAENACSAISACSASSSSTPKAREHHVADSDVGRCERELQHAERHRDKIVEPHADGAFGLKQTAAQCRTVRQAFGCGSPLEHNVAKPIEDVSKSRA